MSHRNDVGFSRHIDRVLAAYILSRNLQRFAPRRTEKRMWRSSSVSALTERTRASTEDAVLGAIKFNEHPRTRTLITEPMMDSR
jgi:hypothetical protein